MYGCGLPGHLESYGCPEIVFHDGRPVDLGAAVCACRDLVMVGLTYWCLVGNIRECSHYKILKYIPLFPLLTLNPNDIAPYSLTHAVGCGVDVLELRRLHGSGAWDFGQPYVSAAL